MDIRGDRREFEEPVEDALLVLAIMILCCSSSRAVMRRLGKETTSPKEAYVFASGRCPSEEAAPRRAVNIGVPEVPFVNVAR